MCRRKEGGAGAGAGGGDTAPSLTSALINSQNIDSSSFNDQQENISQKTMRKIFYIKYTKDEEVFFNN